MECRETTLEMNERLNMLEERSLRCVCCHVGSHLQKASPKSGNASNNNASTSMVRENGSPLSRVNVVQKPWECQRRIPLASCSVGTLTERLLLMHSFIAETDPKKSVHGRPIGFGAYKVGVKTSFVDDALVYGETGECQTIIQGVGNFITWGQEFIVLG